MKKTSTNNRKKKNKAKKEGIHGIIGKVDKFVDLLIKEINKKGVWNPFPSRAYKVEDVNQLNKAILLVITGILVFNSFVFVCIASSVIHSHREDRMPYNTFSNRVLSCSSILLCTGLVTFVFFFVGLVGVMREFILLLRIFYISLIVFLVIKLFMLSFVAVFSATIRSIISTVVTERTIINYRGNSDIHETMDYLQTSYRCCGLNDDGFLDWSMNVYFNCSKYNPSPERCGVPWSCCREDRRQENPTCGQNAQKLDRYFASRFVYTRGCIWAVQVWAENNGYKTMFLLLLDVIFTTVIIFQCTHLVNELQMMNGSYRGPWCFWVGQPRPTPQLNAASLFQPECLRSTPTTLSPTVSPMIEKRPSGGMLPFRLEVVWNADTLLPPSPSKEPRTARTGASPRSPQKSAVVVAAIHHSGDVEKPPEPEYKRSSTSLPTLPIMTPQDSVSNPASAPVLINTAVQPFVLKVDDENKDMAPAESMPPPESRRKSAPAESMPPPESRRKSFLPPILVQLSDELDTMHSVAEAPIVDKEVGESEEAELDERNHTTHKTNDKTAVRTGHRQKVKATREAQEEATSVQGMPSVSSALAIQTPTTGTRNQSITRHIKLATDLIRKAQNTVSTLTIKQGSTTIVGSDVSITQQLNIPVAKEEDDTTIIDEKNERDATDDSTKKQTKIPRRSRRMSSVRRHKDPAKAKATLPTAGNNSNITEDVDNISQFLATEHEEHTTLPIETTTFGTDLEPGVVDAVGFSDVSHYFSDSDVTSATTSSTDTIVSDVDATTADGQAVVANEPLPAWLNEDSPSVPPTPPPQQEQQLETSSRRRGDDVSVAQAISMGLNAMENTYGSITAANPGGAGADENGTVPVGDPAGEPTPQPHQREPDLWD